MKRVKSLFVAASIIAIVVGSVQIAGNVFDLGNPQPKRSELPRSDRRDQEASGGARTAPEATASLVRRPARPAETAANCLAPRCRPAAPSRLRPRRAQTRFRQRCRRCSAHARIRTNDITGSISASGDTKPGGASRAAAKPPDSADRLPAAIGGPKLRDAAIAGDAAAAYAVAVRFAEGRGVPVNLEEAAHWYERAASKGLAPAQFRYASLLEKGLGVKKDLAQARRLYLAAAKGQQQGDA